MKPVRSLRKARGLTLIELMISIAIGLVVVAAVMVSFVGTGKAGRYQAALGQMNQDAQFGLNMLSREVQLAGYVAPGTTLGSASPLFGCDATKTVTPGAIPFVAANVAGQPACSPTVTAPTIAGLEVVYEADVYNTVPTGPGAPSVCTGQAATVSGLISIARNRYFVDRALGGRPELFCASDVGGPQVQLLENVEDMQIWYGISTAASANQVVRYARAADINAIGVAEWSNVMSARICLLMRSAEPVLTDGDAQTYMDCNAVTTNYVDRHLRRAYFTTATVRSKMTP